MPEYRFLADGSFVKRDDHVIAWDSAQGMPVSADEQETWRNAGSPIPQAYEVARQVGKTRKSGVPNLTDMGGVLPDINARQLLHNDANARIQRGIDAAAAALDKIESELPRVPADSAALKQQIQALINAFRAMILAQRVVQPKDEAP